MASLAACLAPVQDDHRDYSGLAPHDSAEMPVRMTIDPRDGRRALISGRMAEVCDALDRLIQEQALAMA